MVAKTDELLWLDDTPESSFGASRFFRALWPEDVSESEEESEEESEDEGEEPTKEPRTFGRGNWKK